ncbi:MAG: methyl-accepting chemotaxis protein [Hyphomicrobiales bacterium]
MDQTFNRIMSFMRSAGSDNEKPEAVWRDVSRHLPAHLADFYTALQTNPELSHHFKGNGHIDHLKTAQMEHWNNLFRDTLPSDYESRAIAIGKAHIRIGLPSGWYMAAYAWMLMRLVPHITAKYKMRPGKTAEALQALILRAFMDMILSNTVYENGVIAEKEQEVAREGDLRNLKNLAGSVGDVNEVALELAHLSRNTRNVSMNAQTISAAAAELVASVEEISRNSEGAAEDARSTDDTVGAGRSAVMQVREAIRNITQAVEETAASVDELSSASEQIGQILTVIEGIAEQTNLLALNATIEAARAGEAGKGFAVVASEVKGLANQTSKSTEDIARRIASLRDGMSTITSTMQRSNSAVAEGEEAISTAAETMDQIASQVRNVSDRMIEISGILHQQKDTSSEIAHNIDAVARTAAENEDLLKSMSDKLHESNTRFSDTAKSWFRADSHRALCEMAKIDHILFRKRVVDTMMGRANWEASAIPDHHGCRLGKWYDSLNTPEIRALEPYKRLAEPHGRVHAAAKASLAAHAAGDSDKALSELRKLTDASHLVLASLDELSNLLHGDLAELDRRQFKRQAVSKPTTVEIDGQQRTVRIQDISQGGARIEGLSPADIGKQIRVVGEDHCCTGTAVWSDGKAGGVRFAEPVVKDKIERFASAG